MVLSSLYDEQNKQDSLNIIKKLSKSKFLQNTSDKNMEMFRIIDGNVECFTKDNFTPGSGWKRGDVIHNISSNPSTLIVSDDIN